MYIATLYESVRSEDVIIWAGAGLSLSSGFPSGNELKKILFDSLNTSEKDYVNLESSLQDLSEEINRIKGNKNHIIRLLQKTFSNTNITSTDIHLKISSIPHFKTIITTNYDELFELVYKDKCDVIYSDKHIAYNNANNCQIYKIHGDFKDPDSIILSKSDYESFFREGDEGNLIWNSIKDKIATKTILFLGYGFEDSNVLVTFDKISKRLGNNRKQFYFVAPDLKQPKINELIKRNIHYINDTADNIINELFDDIKENITADLESGRISAETLRDFLSNFQLKPYLRSEKNIYRIENITSDKPFNGKMSLKINNPEIAKELHNHLQNNTSDVFSLDPESFQELNVWYEGIKMPTIGDLTKFEILPVPTEKGDIDIQFEDGFEVKVNAEIYRRKENIEIKLNFSCAAFKISIRLIENSFKGKFNIKHNELCSDVITELAFFGFLMRLIQKQRFTIFTESGKTFTERITNLDQIEDFEFYLDYFEKLKRIETKFRIEFRNFNFDEISDKTIKTVNNLVSIINDEDLVEPINNPITLTITKLTKDSLDHFKRISINKTALRFTLNNNESISLHGCNITLGNKQVTIESGLLENFDEVLAGELDLKIRSESDTVKVRYNL